MTQLKIEMAIEMLLRELVISPVQHLRRWHHREEALLGRGGRGGRYQKSSGKAQLAMVLVLQIRMAGGGAGMLRTAVVLGEEEG